MQADAREPQNRNFDKLKQAGILALAAFTGEAALLGTEARAEVVKLQVSGQISHSNIPSLALNENIAMSLRFDSDAFGHVLFSPDLTHHINEIKNYSLNSDNHASSGLPSRSEIRVYNSTSPSSTDSIDFEIYGVSPNIDTFITLEAASHTAITKPDLNLVVNAIQQFNDGTFFFRENSNTAGGTITSMSLTPYIPDTIVGDFDGNSIVDANDLNVWKQQFGQSGTFSADANKDNVVDGSDYLAWQRAVGATAANTPLAGTLTASVPEPASVSLLASSALLIVSLGKRIFSRRSA